MIRKNCPFCGAHAVSAEAIKPLEGSVFVRCTACGARGPNQSWKFQPTPGDSDVSLAEKAWDTRLGERPEPGPSIFEQLFGRR